MTDKENLTKNEYPGRKGQKQSLPIAGELKQFHFNSEYILPDVQFRMVAPLGKIDDAPVSGSLSVLNAEEGTFKLCSPNGLWSLQIVNCQQKKQVLDLLQRKFICAAEVLTFHDTTEPEDVRGVVRLYLAFFLDGFRLPRGIEVQLPKKVIDELNKNRFQTTPKDIADNFKFYFGVSKEECFAYFSGYYEKDEEAGEAEKEKPSDVSVESESAKNPPDEAPASLTQVSVPEQSAEAGQKSPALAEVLKEGATESENLKKTESERLDTESKQENAEEAEKTSLSGKGYSIFGKKYDFDVVITGPEGEEYLVVRRARISQKARQSRHVLSLARAKLTFLENTVSPMAVILKESLSETAEYAETWKRYSDKAGDFLLKKARGVGMLHLTKPNLDEGKLIVVLEEKRADNDAGEKISRAVDLLTADDQLIKVTEIPPYIKDPAMTWEQYRKEGEQSKEQASGDPVRIFKVDRAENSLTLDTQSALDGTYVLSLKGEETIIARREKARNLLSSGQTPNPMIARIITHDLREDNSIATFEPQAPKGRQKALSGRVKQKIFPKNPPTPTQCRAIEIALNTPDIAIIQGPPGTGKTTVITAILERLNELSNKTGDAKGRVLITSLQHDAVKNVIDRLRINSLPTVKFGSKEGDNDLEGSVLSWSDAIIEKLKEKNPQLITESRELEEFITLYQIYQTMPSDENAIAFLERAKSVTVVAERRERIEKILEELQPVKDRKESYILRMVRSLRTGKSSFADDGVQNAHMLYDALNDETVMDLNREENRKILSVLKETALSQNTDPDPEMLKQLKEVKQRLFERLIPKPTYRASKERGDIGELYTEIKTEIRTPMNGPDDEINNVLYEFMRELESNPADVSTAVQAYSYAFAATALQSEGKEIRDAKGVSRNDEPEYDTVIVDEAARVNPCDLMIPLAQAKERIILVGDHRQLPHMYEQEVFNELEEDGDSINEGDIKSPMFEHLKKKAEALSNSDGITRFITLDAQYRMHPLLGKFASDEFYEPYDEGFKSPLPAEHFKQKFFDKPLVWIDVPFSSNSKCERIGTSWRRRREAQEIVIRIKDFIEKEKTEKPEKATTFGVISFYSAQVKEVQSLLKKELGDETAKGILVGSVDAFQGREFDVIFLSTVRTDNEPRFRDYVNDRRLLEHEGEFSDDEQGRRDKDAYEKIGRSIYGFLTSPNRLCVALTRQKKLLVVVGDSNIFAGKKFEIVAEKFVPQMKHLYKLCLEEGEIIPCQN